jgi:phosphatidylserine/phosphatidylglycerophosphate/cardiolipin synthase-like enzyme
MALAAGVVLILLSVTSSPAYAAPAPTPYLDAVAKQLRVRAPGTENKVWWFSLGNGLGASWLLQTPYCWGQLSCGQPPPGGAAILSRLTAIIADAQVSVDIADLYQPPDGQFETAIVDGLKEGHRDHPNRVPQVRVLAGTYPFSGASINTPPLYARALEQKLGFKVPLQVGYMMTTVTSWNHEKVIDADGRTAIVGGMNYWTSDYLSSADPVNDVSMQLTGPAAADIDRYTDILWRWTCTHASNGASFSLQGDSKCVENLPTMPIPRYSPGVPMIVVGHLGNGIDVPGEAGKESPPIDHPANFRSNGCLVGSAHPTNDVNDSRSYEYRNPGEDALRALVATAKKSIFISQQDLLSCLPLGKIATEAKIDERLFEALGAKIKERVPISIVLSDGNGSASGSGGSGTYRNGFDLGDVAHWLQLAVEALHVPTGPARQMVCRDVFLATVRNGGGRSWANGKRFANHAKLVDVDDTAFYIGSENLYPSRLQELGVIVEDPAAGETLRRSYIDPPVLKWSRPGALTDPSVHPTRCQGF